MQTTNLNHLLKHGKLISLSKGNVLDKTQLCVLYFGVAVFCCFPIITLVLIILPEVTWNAQLYASMICCDIGSVALISLFAYIKVKNNKLVKLAKIWLTDAIEVEAYSKKIGENRLGLQPKATKIQIKFVVEGVIHKKESTVKIFGGQEGYAGWFNKYADRKVPVLYSPKYDEVLIIKD